MRMKQYDKAIDFFESSRDTLDHLKDSFYTLKFAFRSLMLGKAWFKRAL